jgi:hypothetical protein
MDSTLPSKAHINTIANLFDIPYSDLKSIPEPEIEFQPEQFLVGTS